MCVLPVVACTQDGAHRTFADTGLTPRIYDTHVFKLLGAERFARYGDDVTIYLEGDGHAYVTSGHISTDPTPRNTLVRTRAARDQRSNVAYLARPCQYVGTFTTPCRAAYWDDKRFAPDVIASMNAAVDLIKRRAGATHVHLIGYSGGGAVAVLLAARRNDVASLVTIAGLLDTVSFAHKHQVPLLTNSLNPLDVAPRVGRIKQTHYVGGRDEVVPPDIAAKFVARLPANTPVQTIVIENASHTEGWEAVTFDPER